MKISITGGKGGTGKSMVAVSLAIEFAKKNRTALLDLDVECPNDHLIFPVKRKKYAKIYQIIPKWDFKKCIKCGKCAQVCKQNAIIFVKNKYPAFIKDACVGCKACIVACPQGAISESHKEIGTVYVGKKYKVNLISGELKIGELSSGEVVTEVKKNFEKINKKLQAEIILNDSAAGIGCPVIASLADADYIVAVTEPTPSALSDLKRVLYLADHFKIERGIVINKFNLAKKFYLEMEKFAKQNNIKIIGKIPYKKDFITSNIAMMPVAKMYPTYQKLFQDITKKIISAKK